MIVFGRWRLLLGETRAPWRCDVVSTVLKCYICYLLACLAGPGVAVASSRANMTTHAWPCKAAHTHTHVYRHTGTQTHTHTHTLSPAPTKRKRECAKPQIGLRIKYLLFAPLEFALSIFYKSANAQSLPKKKLFFCQLLKLKTLTTRCGSSRY